MSLELFAKLANKADHDLITEILQSLQVKHDYKQVYHSEYGAYGFIAQTESYSIHTPPLFELSILDTQIVLSVFGGLHEQLRIVEQVSSTFTQYGIFIEFSEE